MRWSLLALVRLALVTGSVTAGIALSLVAGDVLSLLFVVSYGIAGALLILRRPRNIIGWLLLAIGWGLCLASLSVHATPEQLAADTLPTADVLVAWSVGWGWLMGLGSLLTLAILFPDGRLPHGRWRAPAVAIILATLLAVALTAFGPTILVTPVGTDALVAVPNPVALFPELPIWDLVALKDLGIWIVLGELVVGAAVLIVRFRRSGGLQRLQLRWLVAALAFVAAASVVGAIAVPFVGDIGFLPAAIGYPMIPAAITIAVLRYRLYEINVLINRTALYGTVTLALAAFFGLANIGVQRLVETLTGQHSDLVTAALAIGAALSFAPVSRRLRPIADRLLPSRALLTLLFTDIVDSTRRAVELGDQRWRELLTRYRSSVRRELSQFGGHEVDTAGDGFFATFEEPAAAAGCALRVRAAVRDLGLKLRIGLHQGECEMRGEKVSGIAVHTAARIMAAADDGEILLSATVRDALADAQLATVGRGRRELKRVPGEWDVYALLDVIEPAMPAPSAVPAEAG